MRPLVSLCMIAKNEERDLPGCLASVSGLVDEIVLCDTGSTDATAAIARAHGARVVFFEWRDDFAAARNASLAPAQGEWVLYLDADERLKPGREEDCLRRAAANAAADAYSVAILSASNGGGVDAARNIRLFRRLPGVRFENEVHERVEPSLLRAGARIARAAFFIEHHGYARGEAAFREKLLRNLALSRRHLARDPEDAYARFYLGATLKHLGENEEAAEALAGVLSGRGGGPTLRALALNLLSHIHLLSGEHEGAERRALASLAEAPRQNAARLLLGLSLHLRGEHGRAVPLLTEALRFSRLPPDTRKTSLSQEITLPAHETEKALVLSLAGCGRFAEALPHARALLRGGHIGADTLRELGLRAVNAGDWASGAWFLREAKDAGAPPEILAIPLAYALALSGSHGEALAALFGAHPKDDAEERAALRVCALAAPHDPRRAAETLAGLSRGAGAEVHP